MAVPQEFTYDSSPWKTVAPTAYADGWFRAEFNPQLYEGVRRAFFHVLPNCSAPAFHVSQVRAVAQIKPVNWNGSFSAPGDVLAPAWYAGAYTVKLNTLKDTFGAILDDRGDRVAFAGDDHPTQATAMAAFGIYPFIRHSLLTTMSAATGLLSYNLFWVLSVDDYYRTTGDVDLVKQLTPDMMQKLSTLQNKTNGRLPPGSPAYIGWDDRLDGFAFRCALPENQFAFTAIYVQAAKAAAALLQEAGDAANAKKAADAAAAVEADARAAPTWWRAWGIHALAHAVLANMTTAEETADIFASHFTNATQICSLSNFNQYYILKALSDMGQPTAALDSIRLCWGESELALGATTFWEISGLAGQWGKVLSPFMDGVGGTCPPPVPAHSGGSTSLAHPWSSGVTAWLSSHALGLRPEAAGFTVLRAAPLLPVVSGTVPLPGARGVVAASFNATSGTHVLAWGQGVRRALVRLPTACAAGDQAVVTADSRVWRGGWPVSRAGDAADGILASRVSATRASLPWAAGAGMFDYAVEVTLKGEGPVRHVLHVECRAARGGGVAPRLATTAPPFYSHFDWLAPEVARDNATRGNWVGRYGSRGHLLLGSCNVQNSSALPAGVSTVITGLTQGCWTSDAKGSAKAGSALQPPPPSAAPAPRTLGTLHTTGMQPGALDLVFSQEGAATGAMAAPPCFNISLYFCDWDGTRSMDNGGGMQLARRVAVDLLALPKREVAWATTVLAETGAFPLGEYVTYEVCDARLAAGIRIRLYNIIGDNAVLSAVFFD